jgi:8-oxo-dGTP pyrophosphatase MutT (NUDIX family)
MDTYSITLSNIIDHEFTETKDYEVDKSYNGNMDIKNYKDYCRMMDDKKSKVHCSNCGKYGHMYKKCKDPIMSLGIINLFIDDNKLNSFFSNRYILEKIEQKYRQNNYHLKNIHVQKFNDKNFSTMGEKSDLNQYIDIIKSKVKLLMIRRKNTVGYIEFVRGRYDHSNNDAILYLLNQMTHDEINYLKTHTFEEIWSNLWNGKYNDLPLDENIIKNLDTINESEFIINLEKLSSKDRYIYTKIHLKEFGLSKTKFEYIMDNNVLDTLESQINILYEQPEWGFPKGRRNLHEKNLDCAIREFTEETGIDTTHIEVMDRIYPVNETLTGTNNINYKHTYYLSIGKKEDVNLNLPSQKIEIGAIGWFTYDEAKSIIRSYHVNRLKLLDDIIIFMAHNLRYYLTNIVNNNRYLHT